MNHDPTRTDDLLVIGSAREPAHPMSAILARFGWNGGHLMTGAAIALLVILAMIFAYDRGAASTSPERPGAVTIRSANTLRFPMTGSADAELVVHVLGEPGRPATVWLTIVATGLRGGIDYIASAGDCVSGRPHRLARYSASPAPRTGLLVLTLDSLPGPAARPIWITVTSALGANLGGLRGRLLTSASVVAVPPGHRLCR